MSELQKLKEIQPRSQSIHEFILWLGDEKKYFLAHEVPDPDYAHFRHPEAHTMWSPIQERLTTLVAEFFEIDLNKVEAEKLAILDNLAKENKRRAKA